MSQSPRPGRAPQRWLHALDATLRAGRGRALTFWLVPLAVLGGTILGFFVIGEITGAPLYVSLPNGVVIAFVMAGLTVACMTPAAGGPDSDPPPGDDGDTVLGSPGGPWTVVAHLGRPPSSSRPQGPAPAGDPRVPAGTR